MIELIIFDLDGVLVDARELHYQALNRAHLVTPHGANTMQYSVAVGSA